MSSLPLSRIPLRAAYVLLLIGALCFIQPLCAQEQDVPLISGGAGFFTRTSGGKTTYTPTITPLLAAPVGEHLLFETRANFIETFSQSGPNQTYDHRLFLGVTYAQADYIVNKHLTVVGGYFLLPFGTYNERLTPIWIGNFQDAPLIYGLGNQGSGSGAGGEVRGNAYANHTFSIDYTAYISAKSNNYQINSERATGARSSIYIPNARLEIGASYGHLLEGNHANTIGTHVWWEAAHVPLHIRSEYAHAPHSQGYWVEADYRLSQIRGAESFIGRLEPIFRVQQAFRNSPDSTDELPKADTALLDFGLDYHLPHEVRINTSYSRQLSSAGNKNVWETGIVYRFLFPAWPGKHK
jgi:hypothetical protein